ncbi:hypothetical protein L3476_21750 [Paenibacillus thiaminolyticus]|uniref:hypothetical protein n=1 Tax=Paenibacillus thiaminolyticus TaxID=49283 RepID=UPI001163F7F1|nr:hypothetical protein [Paenibacillus thiaminolyticus]NGP60470.1 hypothetical protein [Paenibacillus thiaminolyticus]WCR25892.1 hypothetical protein L3476_21750 [Paenibacillus thiaminolyticus]
MDNLNNAFRFYFASLISGCSFSSILIGPSSFQDKMRFRRNGRQSPAGNDAKIQEFYRGRSFEKGILQKCRNFTRFRLNMSSFEEIDAGVQQFREIFADLA